MHCKSTAASISMTVNCLFLAERTSHAGFFFQKLILIVGSQYFNYTWNWENSSSLVKLFLFGKTCTVLCTSTCVHTAHCASAYTQFAIHFKSSVTYIYTLLKVIKHDFSPWKPLQSQFLLSSICQSTGFQTTGASKPIHSIRVGPFGDTSPKSSYPSEVRTSQSQNSSKPSWFSSVWLLAKILLKPPVPTSSSHS